MTSGAATGAIVFCNRFYAPDHSATSQLLQDLARQLAARGRRVTVIASRMRYDDPQARLPARERLEGVTVLRVATTRFGRAHLPGRALDYLSFYLTAGWALLRTLRRGDIAVSLTDPPLLSLVCGLCARLRGARWVNWLHDLYPEIAAELGVRLARGGSGALLRALRDRNLRAAALNVVLGERMAERLRGAGVPPARLAVIENWADAGIHPVAAADNPLRRDWQLADRFVVGYSGNLGRAHEFRTLLDAAQHLRGERDVVFAVIGGGHGRADLAHAVARHGFAQFRFFGYQPRQRLAESLSVADLHLVSLRPALEGLIVPSKLYGAAAAGRPMIFIGDADGESARWLRRHSAGETVAPGDGAALAAAIRRRRDDVALRAREGAAARAAVELARTRALDDWEERLAALG